MKISRSTFRGRTAWELYNDVVRLTLLAGGGHIARIAWCGKPKMNPLWETPWTSREPWTYKPPMAKTAGSQLLSSIAGHNLCLGWFGDASVEEVRAGLGCHGEAPVRRWRRVRQRASKSRLELVLACDLPAAQMRVTRTITLAEGECAVRLRDAVQNLARRDVPYTMCQHVTIGPPFLEAGVTVCDLSATQGHSFPGAFSDQQRLKSDTAFAWPKGPGQRGPVDLRHLGDQGGRSSDFTTQRMDPSREDAWLSALNPRLGMLLAYSWKRADYPWVGNWEENRARMPAPWNGRTLARGLEFSNTPFPVGLRAAVDRGTFQGEKTFRWLPARCKVETAYTILLLPVPHDVSRVQDIRPAEDGFEVDLK
ncbi:MAG: DUF4432 family protein [Verrucomicrobia bacterium]|nr:DUF4432 family protein [Verrucomicrobiota bacterium]